jgi:hypothetical protein
MPLDPLHEWQERYSRSGTQLGFKPETDAPFHSSVQPLCDSPRIVRSTLTPGLLFRDRKMMGDKDDNVSLVISLGRSLSINHRKREACLARNEAILFQADAPGSAGTRQRFAVLESVLLNQNGKRATRAQVTCSRTSSVITRKRWLFYSGTSALLQRPAFPL